MSQYEAVIGLEVHVQIKTDSKMFCSCANRFGGEPNTRVCPVCMGYPGVLPVPNKTAIMRTVAAGLLTNCEIAKFSKFDRKSYFYPDMPKNYQISQYDLPFCLRGNVHIEGEGFSGEDMGSRDIGITRIHLEEDVAKLTHLPGSSGVDYNRAGIPLMEIVSEPDMRTPNEAYAYLNKLKQIMQYAGISDCDMEKGQMRCDVNISVRKVGEEKFGTKIEIKNLNSFRAAHRSLEYEIWRQPQVLDAGGTLNQETRGWNDDRGETYLMRTKESDHDYRYFPDPDLMPVTLEEEDIEKIRATLPELPDAMRQRFVKDYALTEYDAKVLTQEKAIADYFETGVQLVNNPKTLANWIISELLRELSGASISIEECQVSGKQLADMIKLIENNTISGKIAKDVFAEMFKTGKDAPVIVKEKGLEQVTDTGAIEGLVDQAIANNHPQVQQYKDGNHKVIQFFVGQVMKLSKGKANPQMVVKMLKGKLDA
ncbi:MAG: Asp-tRNA(Asn)/Glu-tRNA(Gln) amidotransferase subunit GatB [Lentisphaerae bacterium]|nr:Asp-tRNA(Asn)/Glu-tRNA(Gln) amidotransferase subunit GatB [Lentisphaerota bacterium]MCP4099915.1 Asp-tRNA(Asn)/Glu-tRNA(Gln) amidotransferase subunit GatB [Lentisphaerota bacterium]